MPNLTELVFFKLLAWIIRELGFIPIAKSS